MIPLCSKCCCEPWKHRWMISKLFGSDLCNSPNVVSTTRHSLLLELFIIRYKTPKYFMWISYMGPNYSIFKKENRVLLFSVQTKREKMRVTWICRWQQHCGKSPFSEQAVGALPAQWTRTLVFFSYVCERVRPELVAQWWSRRQSSHFTSTTMQMSVALRFLVFCRVISTVLHNSAHTTPQTGTNSLLSLS